MTKASLRDRGLTFEMILSAPVLGCIPNPARHGQMLLMVEMVLLFPAARTRLEELAAQTGSLSAAVEKAVMAFPY